MIKYILLFSRHGKARLQKFYIAQTDAQRKKINKDIVGMVLREG